MLPNHIFIIFQTHEKYNPYHEISLVLGDGNHIFMVIGGWRECMPQKWRTTLKEHYREQTRANTIMGFSISIIIAFVGILNFINSMVTAIVSRQKEFAMIQSIGMTRRQLRCMLVDEGLLYAGSTLAASYVMGTLAVSIGVRMAVSGDWTATFRFTLLPLIVCTPILLLFACLIPYICFKNLEKQSLVERLRATD